MGSIKLVCYKNARYMGSIRTCPLQEGTFMGSIRTCILQECTLHGVNKYLSVTRSHVIWGQQRLVWYKNARYMGSISTCLLQEGTHYHYQKLAIIVLTLFSRLLLRRKACVKCCTYLNTLFLKFQNPTLLLLKAEQMYFF